MKGGNRWALGCVGFLIVLVVAGGLGFWQMSRKYGMTTDPETILARTATILPLEFKPPLVPGYTQFTASEQRDPLVLYGVDDRRSKTVLMMASIEGEATLVEFSNRLHNIRRDLVPWREVLNSGDRTILTAAGREVAGQVGDYQGEDGVDRTAVLVVVPWEGRSVLVAAEGRPEDIDVGFVQALLDGLPASGD